MKASLVLISLVSFLIFTTSSFANQKSYIGGATVTLKPLHEGNVNDADQWTAVATASVNPSFAMDYAFAESYVELSYHKLREVVCRMIPIEVGNASIASTQKTVEFAVNLPHNQGVNPQEISATTNASRATSAKLENRTAGIGWKLECRPQLGEHAKNIQVYGYIKVTGQD